MKKHCVAIRVLAHTQISKVALKQKKAHMMEIQVRTQPGLGLERGTGNACS